LKPDLLSVAEQAARSAGELLLTEFRHDAKVKSTCGRDIKTHADIAANNAILSILEPTNIHILSEETLNSDIESFDLYKSQWIVDPLDGTLNFSRKFPFASVSVAYWEAGKPVLGVIYDLASNTLLSGYVGAGASRDGDKIHVSTTTTFDQAILATGFPTGSSCDEEHVHHLYQRLQSFKKVRMLGCASLMLAYVASGQFDAYEERDIYIWDVAAGLALVAAANGQFQLKPGRSPVQYHVYATNNSLTIP
jgi:myo-inositol-1(or 4)-monophosphatase